MASLNPSPRVARSQIAELCADAYSSNSSGLVDVLHSGVESNACAAIVSQVVSPGQHAIRDDANLLHHTHVARFATRGMTAFRSLALVILSRIL